MEEEALVMRDSIADKQRQRAGFAGRQSAKSNGLSVLSAGNFETAIKAAGWRAWKGG